MTHKETYQDSINYTIDNMIGNINPPTLKTQITIKDGKNGIIILSNLKNKTVLGGRLKILENLFGIDPNPDMHLTLNSNQLLNIPHSVNTFQSGLANQRKMQWFMIGIGGENLSALNQVYKPRNYETNLYIPVPFRCVPINNDLSDSEAEKYRLRKMIVINGNQYYAYYAKKFDISSIKLTFNESNYIPLASDTVPLSSNDDDSNLDSPDHRLSGGKVLSYGDFTLTVAENEFKEWYKLTHNDQLVGARLSELGLVSGYDALNTLTGKMELADAELMSKLTHSPIPLDEEGSERLVQYVIYT